MPGSTTSNRFYCVYALQSAAGGNRYVGFTTDLVTRVREHNSGRSFATAPIPGQRLKDYYTLNSKLH